MSKRINISNLWDEFQKNDFLIVGSPKGVGFTTFIAEWSAEQMFMQDDYSILILTADRRTQIDLRFKILKNYKYYHNDGIANDENIVYTKRKNGSVTGIYCYEDFDIYSIDEFYDCIIIDTDDFSDRLYGSLEILMDNTAKLIFNTNDLPQSIFYNLPNTEKVVISSEYNKKLKNDLKNTYSDIVNFDRILDGKFTEY
jgi:hypothetical protein